MIVPAAGYTISREGAIRKKIWAFCQMNKGDEAFMELGAWTLLPPLVIIVMAIKTKSTTSSLVAGALLCCILQYKTGSLTGFIDLMY